MELRMNIIPGRFIYSLLDLYCPAWDSLVVNPELKWSRTVPAAISVAESPQRVNSSGSLSLRFGVCVCV